MARRKTDPEPFPTRGTPTGYRDSGDSDDRAVIQAQIAERERLLVAARETAVPRHHGTGLDSRKTDPRYPTAADDRIATQP